MYRNFGGYEGGRGRQDAEDAEVTNFRWISYDLTLSTQQAAPQTAKKPVNSKRKLPPISGPPKIDPVDYITNALVDMDINYGEAKCELGDHHINLDSMTRTSKNEVKHDRNVELSRLRDHLQYLSLPQLSGDANDAVTELMEGGRLYCAVPIYCFTPYRQKYKLLVLSRQEGGSHSDSMTSLLVTLSSSDLSLKTLSGVNSGAVVSQFSSYLNMLNYICLQIVVKQGIVKEERGELVPTEMPGRRYNSALHAGGRAAHDDMETDMNDVSQAKYYGTELTVIQGSEREVKQKLKQNSLDNISGWCETSVIKDIPKKKVKSYISLTCETYELDSYGRKALETFIDSPERTLYHESYNSSNPLRGYLVIALKRAGSPGKETLTAAIFKFVDEGRCVMHPWAGGDPSSVTELPKIRNLFRYVATKAMIGEGMFRSADLHFS